MKPKKKFRKCGKITTAMCPICGEFMAMEIFETEAGEVHIYYCKNPNHEFTAPDGIFEK
jgi:hypothetical protein